MDVDTGAEIGRHDGYFGFTIGQRKGLGLRAPAADGRPRYVLGVEPVSGSVLVGSAARLDVSMVKADRVVFPSGAAPEFPFRRVAQLRAHGGTVPASADLVDGRLRVLLETPARGVAPGQTVVLYDPTDTDVLGRRDDRADGMTDAIERIAPPAEGESAGSRIAHQSWHEGAATGVGSLPGTSTSTRRLGSSPVSCPTFRTCPSSPTAASAPTWSAGRSACSSISTPRWCRPAGGSAGRPGRDVRRARDLLAWDLDAAQEHFAGAPCVKVQVCGPWTLAAQLEVSSGNRALTDAGAVDDLAASLTEGVLAHVDELARRVPGAGVVVQLDEPALPAVLAGSLRTASGLGTVAPVADSRVGQVLRDMVDALGDRPTIAHCCAAAPPIGLLRAAGFGGLSIDFSLLGAAAAGLDPIGEAVEGGAVLVAGVVPATYAGSPSERSLRQWAEPLVGPWRRLGLPRTGLGEVVVTPTCGLAGATPDWAVQAMRMSRELARALVDPPEGW